MNTIEEIAEKFDMEISTIQKAYENLSDGKSLLVAVSGKIGSGKDTIAPLILKSLKINESVQEYFAKPLKKEIQEVIDIISNTPSKNEAIDEIVSTMRVSESDAAQVYEFLCQEAIENQELTAYSRTVGIRKALQYWATEVRRAADENYWVDKTIKNVYQHLSEGKSVYVTDTRFPNEAEAIIQNFGYTVRLDVSYEEQSRRIMLRDGLEVSESTRNHASETALDEYNNFTVRILTDKLSPSEITERITQIINSTN